MRDSSYTRKLWADYSKENLCPHCNIKYPKTVSRCVRCHLLVRTTAFRKKTKLQKQRRDERVYRY